MNRLSTVNPDLLPPSSFGVKSEKTIKLESDKLKNELKRLKEIQDKISDSQRRYMKCSNEKCIKQLSELERKLQKEMMRNTKPDFVSKSVHDKKLQKIFVDIGRKKRIEILEKDIAELDLKIAAAKGRLYLKEEEDNFKKIAENLDTQTELAKEIEKTKVEISHIKSQFKRLERKKEELKKETESEMKFAEHLKKANRQLEIYENRVQNSREKECLKMVENEKLSTLIRAMLHDRAFFNHNWTLMVKKLKDRKKFLVDMVERSIQGFSRNADFMENLKQITNRRAQGTEAAAADMIKMKRQIDSNKNYSEFLGGKGKKIQWPPLLDKEIRRRENVERAYTDELNLYAKIISNIKKFAGDNSKSEQITPKALQFLNTLDNNCFQIYNFLNELQHSTNTDRFRSQKVVIDANKAIEEHNSTKQFLQNKIDEKKKIYSDEIEVTLKMKDDVYKIDGELDKLFDLLKEIVDLLECDLTDVEGMLGNNEKINLRNLSIYLQIMEQRINEMVAFVYCDERDGGDILAEDDKLIVQSLKRPTNKIVKLDEVMQVSQCAECGELEDVDEFNLKPISMLGGGEAVSVIKKKYQMPELESRMHNLLSCSLPRSGVVASRRYAE